MATSPLPHLCSSLEEKAGGAERPCDGCCCGCCCAGEGAAPLDILARGGAPWAGLSI